MSSTFSWALFAAALLLFVFAVRTFFANSEREPQHQVRLGCGFGFVALIIWSIALQSLLSSWELGIRMACALVLLLPIAQVFSKPNGGGAVRAIMAAAIAIVLAGPILPEVGNRLLPDKGQRLERDLVTHIAKLRDELDRLQNFRTKLETGRIALKEELAGRGFDSFDALNGDPASREKLEEILDIDRSLTRTVERHSKVQGRLDRLERDLRQLKRQLDAERILGPEEEREEFERIRREIDSYAPGGAEGPVEELAEEDDLRKLFEHEF